MVTPILTKSKIVLKKDSRHSLTISWKELRELLEQIEDKYDLSEIKKLKKSKTRSFDQFLANAL